MNNFKILLLIAIVAYFITLFFPLTKEHLKANLFKLSRFYDLIKGNNFVRHFYCNDPDENLDEELAKGFDFIIIGAGSAGAVIANRLSENCKWRVLLLEAGREETSITQIPASAATLMGTEYDWNFKQQKQDNFGMGFKDDIPNWCQGKALGGGSAINFMIYTRGTAADYNRWAQKGNEGWSFMDVLPFFRKSENYISPDPIHRNKGGELSVTESYGTSTINYIHEAAKEFGLKFGDHNSGTNVWMTDNFQMTIKNGQRHSTASAFLYPIRKRNNLVILPNSLVTRILIDHKLKSAYGVQFRRNNQNYTVKVKKEVILSAGAANTPKLLMISGIGPKEELSKIGIQCVKDLPGVGKNLRDHLLFLGLTFKLPSDKLPYHNFWDILLNPKHSYNYTRYGKGFYTHTGLGSLSFIKVDDNYSESKNKTSMENDLNDYPDIEFLYVPMSMAWDGGHIQAQALRIKDEYFEKVWKPLIGQNTFQVGPVLLHPKSTGYIKLNESNPHGDPIIYGNYFSDSNNNENSENIKSDGKKESLSDIKKMVKAIRFAKKLILKSKTFSNFNPELVTLPMPGCESMEFDSDPYWECALRRITLTVFHPVGTAKMGKESDKLAVVDNHLKVHGVNNLRVADASIMPNHISGHTSAVCTMIGEKAADLIINSY